MQMAELHLLILTSNDLGECSLLMCVDLTIFTSRQSGCCVFPRGPAQVAAEGNTAALFPF